MKKIIAKTTTGTEYIYSRLDTYQVSKTSADIICKAMNRNKYNLKPGEKWHVYSVDDYTYDNATNKAKIYKGKVRLYETFHNISWTRKGA